MYYHEDLIENIGILIFTSTEKDLTILKRYFTKPCLTRILRDTLCTRAVQENSHAKVLPIRRVINHFMDSLVLHLFRRFRIVSIILFAKTPDVYASLRSP